MVKVDRGMLRLLRKEFLMKTATYKHLTLQDRITIQSSLNQNESFKKIANTIGKDCSTISKEVRLNLRISKEGGHYINFNDCLSRKGCTFTNLCTSCSYKRSRLCFSCKFCTSNCSLYQKEICLLLRKPPYVCNACKQKIKCSLAKHFYEADFAHNRYREKLSEARKGILLSQKDIDHLNQLLVPLIQKQGLSIHHVYLHHKDEIMFSEKTLYKLIDSGVLKVRNMDLPRKVRYRTRKKKPTYKVDKKCLESRRYEDFITYCNAHPDIPIVQMDSVEGVKGGKVLLTIHFTSSHLMLAFLREYNDSQSVIDVFDTLDNLLGRELFKKMFPLILTDNGSEFSNPLALELDKDGNQRTKIFYCHPSSPYEKGSCEVNHELVRRIQAKGNSFDDWTQEAVNLMMSHINSYARESLHNCTPIALFTTIFGGDILPLLEIQEIHPDKICLKSCLITDFLKTKEDKNNER